MPIASVSSNTESHELKSCPGGWIVVKRLSYGDKLKRMSLMRMSLQLGGDKKNTTGEMALGNQQMTYLDFAKCIIEHNLEIAEGKLFDFGRQTDIDQLDPVVGEEISGILDSLNNFEDDDEIKH